MQSGEAMNPERDRELRIEALKIHKELIERFTLKEVQEIIRHLTMIEAVLARDDGDESHVKEVHNPDR
jgi:hypothetical protein